MDLNSMDQFMSAIILIAGIMAIYYAITGKGKFFSNDYPKEMKEEANTFTRKFCWILGPVAIVSGVLGFLLQGVMEWITTGVMFASIVVYIILFQIKFGKYLKKKKKS